MNRCPCAKWGGPGHISKGRNPARVKVVWILWILWTAQPGRACQSLKGTLPPPPPPPNTPGKGELARFGDRMQPHAARMHPQKCPIYLARGKSLMLRKFREAGCQVEGFSSLRLGRSG